MFNSLNSIYSLKSKQKIIYLYEQIIPLTDDQFTSSTTTNNNQTGYEILAFSTSTADTLDPYLAYTSNYTLKPYTFVSDSSLNTLRELLQIKLPGPIILKSFFLRNRDSAINRFPKIFQLVGSNDRTT